MTPHSPMSPVRRREARAWLLVLALALAGWPLAAQEEGEAQASAEEHIAPEEGSPGAPVVSPALPVFTAAEIREEPAEDVSGAEPSPPPEFGESVPESAPTVRFVIREQPITMALPTVEEDLGARLIPRGAAAEQVIPEFVVRDLTLDELLAKIHNELGWQWYRDDTMPPGTYELYTDEDFRAMVLPNLVIEKSFYLENISSTTAAEFVSEILSEVGSVADIPRTNEIIVTDLPQYVEAVERLLAQVDVKLYMRVFHIRNADVLDVADAIERFRSPEGSIQVDERTHRIIVEDLFQNIRRMDLLIEQLDVGTVLETYHLNYMSEDDISDLEAALEAVVSPDALLEVNLRTGMIILDDIPEVHERAAELIRAYDEPTRQILLQADVIQVRTTSNLAVETQFNLSGDLFSARADSVPGTGNVPISGRTGADITDNLGFLDVRDEFPAFALDSGGLRFEYLSSHFRALLATSLTRGDAQLLLSPRIQVKDKEPAVIDVGGEVPFVTTTINDNFGSGTRTFTQQAVREGLLLEVTPFIGNNGYVELQVRIENNDAEVQSRNVIDGTIDVVERRTQQIETSLIIPDGGTRVIAGLLTSSTTESRQGPPFLSTLPYVGWLFGKTTKDDLRDNLMIFLTPTILIESATDYQWRPLYDELPVSARYATTMPEEPPPLRPADLELLAPLGVPGGPTLQREDLTEVMGSPEFAPEEMPPLLPADVAEEPPLEEEFVPGASPEEEVPVEEMAPMAGEETTLPLVDEELLPPGAPAEELPRRPQMSFREGAGPQLRGTLQPSAEGGVRTSASQPRAQRASRAASERPERQRPSAAERGRGERRGRETGRPPTEQETSAREGRPR